MAEASLFPESRRWDLPAGGTLLYVEGWLGADEADAAYATIETTTAWRSESITMFDRQPSALSFAEVRHRPTKAAG